MKPGKAPGAFAHPTVTEVHPYVMLNYLGKQRDVMTLAHELGHGVHQVLAADQGELLSSTPLTLAETASVFGEMLTFRKLLDAAPDKATRKRLLAGKVEDMINTVVRQIAFYDFECKLHAARAEGELTPDQINELWMSVQAESLGPVFYFMDGYETFWSYIPHFIHSPFYVYAYAFGDGLVNALYAVYREGDAGFQDKYFEMLRSGCDRSEVLGQGPVANQFDDRRVGGTGRISCRQRQPTTSFFPIRPGKRLLFRGSGLEACGLVEPFTKAATELDQKRVLFLGEHHPGELQHGSDQQNGFGDGEQ